MDKDDTKAIIADRFLELIRQRPYDDVSIGDVAAAANVSRQTFYYFDNLFDVCVYILNQERERRRPFYVHKSLLDNLVEEARTVAAQRDVVSAVYKSRSRPKLQDHIFQNSYNMALLHFTQQVNIVPDEDVGLTCRFLTHAYTGLTMEWIGDGMPDTLPDIARVVRALVNYITLYGSDTTPKGDSK